MRSVQKRLVSKREMMWRVFYQQNGYHAIIARNCLEKRKKVNPVWDYIIIMNNVQMESGFK